MDANITRTSLNVSKGPSAAHSAAKLRTSVDLPMQPGPDSTHLLVVVSPSSKQSHNCPFPAWTGVGTPTLEPVEPPRGADIQHAHCAKPVSVPWGSRCQVVYSARAHEGLNNKSTT